MLLLFRCYSISSIYTTINAIIGFANIISAANAAINISSNIANLILTTNHIYIGGVYIITGLIGGAIGFGLPIILRLELALPRFIVCSSLQYNPNVSFHGIFMISSMIMPILIGGFGNILLPLMLCSSDMIFPRLNALSL